MSVSDAGELRLKIIGRWSLCCKCLTLLMAIA